MASENIESSSEVEPDDDYVSETTSPAPSLAASAELEARMARLERLQAELAANLNQAHRAFALLNGRVGELAERHETLQARVEQLQHAHKRPTEHRRPRRWLARLPRWLRSILGSL
jgi:hypothetical protein